MNITSVLPNKARRGAGGDTITITGSGFGGVGGSVEIGGVAAIPGTWADGQITVKADDVPATPLGAQDVKVIDAGAVEVTKEKAVYIYDDTERFDSDELDTGKMQALYVDGLHVGYLEGEVSVGTDDQTLDSMSNDREDPVLTYLIRRTGSVAFVMKQLNGPNIALALGGNWDAVNKVVSVARGRTITEHSIMILDAGGRGFFCWRCQLITPTRFSLSPEAEITLPVTLRVLGVDDATGEIFRVVLP